MRKRRMPALFVAVAMATTMTPAPLIGLQDPGAISGVSKEGGNPNRQVVRARDVDLSQIVAQVPLNDDHEFALTGLPAGNYVLELFDLVRNEVVCTESLFPITADQPILTDVEINCGGPLGAWWWVGAAGLVGLTTALITTNDSTGNPDQD